MVKPPAPLMISTAVVATGTLHQPNKNPTNWGSLKKFFSVSSAPSAVRTLSLSS